MNRQRLTVKIVLIGMLLLILASCSPEGLTTEEMAATFAAQTLMAVPTDTETPLPTETLTPTTTPTEEPTPTPLPILGPVGPVDFPEDVNPLTGLWVSDPTILERRPVFVKVANYPVSGRPHAGLSFADIVFEYYIGAGGNRFIALYYGQDAPMIGPVRSGRLVDPQLVSLYEGILGFEGAYVTIMQRITGILGNRAISGKDNCPAICDDGRNIVISVFADSEALTTLSSERGVDNQRYLLEGMAFDPEEPQGGELGDQVMIEFSRVNPSEWQFDEESGLYLRWIDNATGQEIDMIPLVDRITDEQLGFANVIVLFANYEELAPTLHDIDVWDNPDGQRAVIFRDGQAYDVTWATPDKEQPIQFLDEDGEVFWLKPGNTWVAIMGLNSEVAVVDGLWTFNFNMP